MGLFDSYIPADVPTGEIDPRELERARAMAMIRAGLGMANREPAGSAIGGGLKAYLGMEQQARQSMLAQLQAYKARQEIGAKAREQQEHEALTGRMGKVFDEASITQPGGPTPNNATLMMIEKLRAGAVELYRAGKVEDATRMMASAKDLVEKWSTTPHMVKGPSGELRMGQLSEQGNMKVQDVLPYEKQHFTDTGGAIQARGEYTGNLGASVPKTLSPEGRISAGNLDLSQKRFAYEKSAPVWDPGSRQFITKPTAEAPTGTALTPTGVLPPHGKNAPEAYTKQVGGIVNVNTAIENYLKELSGFTNLDLANTTKRAQIGTAYNNTMLQLKEAYNLGVLNGPDYSILTTVLTDPLTMKGAVTSNAAIVAQAAQIREVLRKNAQNLARVHKQPLSDIDEWLPAIGAQSPVRAKADAIIGGKN